MLRRAALGLIALICSGSLLPAAAQELRFFYCFAPDPASGTVYASPTLPIGPVGERAGYGTAFAGFLKAQGVLTGEAAGYCVMRATEAEIDRGRRELAQHCPECGGATTVTEVDWPRNAARSSSQAIAERYKQNVLDAVRLNDPGVCMANADGSVRCTGSPPTGTETRAHQPNALTGDPVAVDPPNSAPASLCIPDHAGAMREPCHNGQTLQTADPPQESRQQEKEAPGEKRERPHTNVPAEQNSEPPRREFQTVCAELTPGGMTKPIVRIRRPEIQVTMSPGTLLYLRDIATGGVFRLGYGKHVIPTGDYVLGVIGYASAGDPLRQAVQACLRHDVSPA